MRGQMRLSPSPGRRPEHPIKPMIFGLRRSPPPVIRLLRPDRSQACARLHAEGFAHPWSPEEMADLIASSSTVGAAARLHDLIVVSQAEPDRDTFDNQLPQELLLQAGGPLLFFPSTFRGAFRPSRIGICWDGSRLAARALHDAMPLLAEADTLTAITMNERDVPPEASPAERKRRGLGFVAMI